MPKITSPERLRAALVAAPLAGLLVLSGCSGGGEPSNTAAPSEAEAANGFTLMVAQANDQDDYYAQLVDQYAEETGAEIEVIPYPSDAYNSQVTTQLQAGNAADAMILSPGTGQPISVINLAEAGFLEPLTGDSPSTISDAFRGQVEIDGTLYAQPTSLTPVGLVWNEAASATAGVDEFPADFDALLEACATAREAGTPFTVVAGAIPFNTGLLAQLVSSSRVYADAPDWNQQRAAGEVTFADSEWRTVLEDIQAMADGGCFQDGAAGGTFDSITQGLGGGTALTAALPGSAAASIGEASGQELVVEAFPPAAGGERWAMASPNYAWAINAAAEPGAKAAVQEFLDWAAQPEQVASFAEMSGALPVTGIEADSIDPSYAPIADLLAEGSYAGIANAQWPNPATYDALGTGVQGLLTGQTTVDQVLESMDAAWGE